MSTYGREIIETAGRSIQVSANGQPEFKHAGITLDWGLVVAHSGADITLLDGVVISDGEKYVRYGQVVVLVGVAEVQTLTFTGGPTAGSAIVTLPTFAGELAQTAVALAFDATAVAAQTALENLTRIGPGGVTVTRAGAGSAGSPYAYTITFNRALGDVPQLTSSHTFTGGTTPTTTHATTTAGETAAVVGGKYGPYDPALTNGQQTIARDFAFIVNETMRQDEANSDHPAVLYGGLCWKNRIKHSGLATASLALGPTLANLHAAFPRLQLVTEQ